GVGYRVGAGRGGAMVAVLGFGLAAQATSAGLLSPIARSLWRMEVSLGGAPATLPGLLGVGPWWLVAPLAAILGAWVLRNRESRFQTGWRWPVAGVALGAVGLLGWLTSGATGRGWGLSITGPSIGLVRLILSGELGYLNWGTFLIVALPVGAFLGAWSHGEFALRAPPPGRLLQAFLGGLMMGFGAALAGGCNIGHSFTGVSVLALSSLTTTAFIIRGVWTAVQLLVLRAKTRAARERRVAPAAERVPG
ncbi:MAG: YeeE/YedE family protein, partial [Nitrospinota bacterium]